MTAPDLDFTVIRVGTDTSGRPLYMTRYAWSVWKAVLAHPDVKPFAHKITLVQGAFMERVPGGGASASAGYHNKAKCWDVRTWNLTRRELNILVRVCRFEAAMAIWRRDYTAKHGGMDPHAHVTFGADQPGSSGAIASWKGYVRGTNGLANGAADYEVRPSPLVLRPKASLFEEGYMGTTEAEQKLDKILAAVEGIDTDLGRLSDAERRRFQEDRRRQSERYRALVDKIGGLADKFTEEGNSTAREAVLKLLADEEDVTGKDNPVEEDPTP